MPEKRGIRFLRPVPLAQVFAASSPPRSHEVDMNSQVLAGIDRSLDHASIDEWIVETLCRRGTLTLDFLNSLFPKCEEARLLFAVDRLSRAGRIVISPPQGGDYLISVQTVDDGSVIRAEETSVRPPREPVFARAV